MAKSRLAFDPLLNRRHFLQAVADGSKPDGSPGDDNRREAPAEEREFAAEEFTVIDEFEIHARDLLDRREAVKPPLSKELLLADSPAIEKHTRQRNARHLGKVAGRYWRYVV